jgi:hypothetical protein
LVSCAQKTLTSISIYLSIYVWLIAAYLGTLALLSQN